MSCRYSLSNFFFTILVPILLMAGVLVWGIFDIYRNGSAPLNNLVLVAMPFMLFMSIVGINNPARVNVNEEGMTLSLGLIKHSYKWSHVKSVKVKDYAYIGKFYFSIDSSNHFFGGRYWISGSISDSQDLKTMLIGLADAERNQDVECGS
ncbi:hypothetical protein ACFOLA_06850 [Salinicoccus hispanicus]|uniref:PH domain-containing protein n=1 Tax=Salinicoccus hispanicus TaxID=157225 RepID=A0A6N8U091_9STAP|nr:hypothetical protein [Salinicoccus hispanicus]MXQ51484.1 hypothetical protein [Salinicoccus hispanicus]